MNTPKQIPIEGWAESTVPVTGIRIGRCDLKSVASYTCCFWDHINHRGPLPRYQDYNLDQKDAVWLQAYCHQHLSNAALATGKVSPVQRPQSSEGGPNE